jgi:ribosomal protein S18 acetylase RimI-like enzyme
MQVREATNADREVVVTLWRAAGLVVDYNPPDADFDRALAQPQSAVLMGEVDGALAASCMVGDDGHRGWVYYVSVDPTYRSAGLGREIMDAATDWLKARGLRKAMLMVRPSNTKVIGFYNGVGWTEEPRTMFANWVRPKYENQEEAS